MMSDLQLKKELNQIKKAARVLRDPGTTTSWKSPLSSSRSATTAAAAVLVASGALPWKSYDGCETVSSKRVNGKKVFLCNWRQKMCDEEVEDSESSSGSLRDWKSDSCFGSGSRSVSGMPGVARRVKCGSRKKSKRRDTQLGRYQSKEMDKLVQGRKMLLQGLSQDDLVEQSDGTTENYCYYNYGDLKRGSDSVVSPMVLGLKCKNWAPLSSRLLKNSRKEGSLYSYSSTPALSTSSFNRYGNRNPSIAESWDSNVDDDVDDPLGFPGRQGCGIPCYWSRRMPKHSGGSGSCYSSSFSDTLKKKGSSIFFGSHTPNHRRRWPVNSCTKRRIASRSAQGVLPLLNGGGDCQERSSLGSGCSEDGLSTKLEELDLEALSRLDGRRWSSSCRSRDGLEIVALNDCKEEEGSPENIRSLTSKYKPLSFADIIGQNIVVHSLINAILRGRIAPFYLFQGPRGTGKTSTARIFASALNCSGPVESKPCGYCRECTDYISCKSRDISEADATNKNQIDKVRHYLKNLMLGSASVFSHNNVFIVDECHLLHSHSWLEFLKYLEEPLPRVVFIFITTDIDNVPHKVQSRCQKYLFNKIKESDIVFRLKKITAEENLDVEPEALDLIATNADGSLRDAETMLDQLSLLAKTVTTSLVNELVGVVSDEKLLELLGLTMSSNSAKTVKLARELMDSGADPIVLMSQLASLIMDIIAGSCNTANAKYSRSFIDGGTHAELDRLKHALKLLSEAEKQLRFSSDRSTWFTATLLQLGCSPSADLTQSSSRRQSSKTAEDDLSSASRDSSSYKHNLYSHYMPRKSNSPALMSKNPSQDDNHKRLDDIWRLCIERCHSKTLRQLLHLHGKLVSVSEVEGIVVVYITFGNENIKSRAERFLSSITNSMEIVLRCNVDIRILHLPEDEASMNTLVPLEIPGSLKEKDTSIATERERNGIRKNKTICSKLGSGRSLSKGSFNDDKLKEGLQDYTNRSVSSIDERSQSSEFVSRVAKISGLKERGQGIPMQRIKSIIREQRLETAWLQAEEKGTPASLSWLKPEKNQVLPQDGVYHQNQLEPLNSADLSVPHWEDEINHELSILKKNDIKAIQKEQIGRYSMSPSLLHDSNFVGSDNKDNLGYESGSGPRGCSGLFCWNRTKPQKRGKVRGTPVRSRRGTRFSLLGECGKAQKSKNKVRR